MRARTRLNQAYFNGSLLIAALLGLLAQSWPLFFLALVMLLASNLYLREIRPSRRRRGHNTQKSRRGEKA
jgi:hypothetical protein